MTLNLPVALHVAGAIPSAVLGAIQYYTPKGTRQHKIIGYAYVASMTLTSISSFWLKEINEGQYSWIHGLSILTLSAMGRSIYYARIGNIKKHKSMMRNAYISLIVAGLFTFAQGRRMRRWLVGGITPWNDL
ncbi:hypothetical protein HDV06_002016 [Boothiomyces sp. JEL0866]|nr:hypothetical protein HDV06_002016 [Boothiomyces sp. JEL0866]